MEEILKWIDANYDTLALILGGIAALDGVAGFIPDKLLPYVGFIRRLLTVILRRK